jgi:hypothetical protein
MWRKSGRRKASVLPEPVLAMPIMSRPDMMMGMACAWGPFYEFSLGHYLQTKK